MGSWRSRPGTKTWVRLWFTPKGGRGEGGHIIGLGWAGRAAYLGLNMLFQHIRMNTGRGVRLRSQTRSKSYRKVLVVRHQTKEGECGEDGTEWVSGCINQRDSITQPQDSSQADRKSIDGPRIVETDNSKPGCLRLSSAKARRTRSLWRNISSSTPMLGPYFRGSRAASLASISACWSSRALMVGSREEAS